MAVPAAVAVGVGIVAVGAAIDQIASHLGDGQLSLAERVWLYGHPHTAYKIRDCTKEARRQEHEYFGSSGEDDEGDAFRHCYWSALLTRDIGQELSGFFTSLHEVKDGNPKNRKTMDLHNNGVGRWTYFADTSNKGIAQKCLKLLAAGKLLVESSKSGKAATVKALAASF
jgi:hypothetical protein